MRLFFAALAVLVGCGGTPDDAPVCHDVERSPDRPASRVRTIDDDLADIVMVVPGFGGFRVEDGRLVVLLLEPDDAAANRARDELARLYPSGAWRTVRARATQTAFDYRQLLDFYNRSFDIWSLESVSLGDLDESRGLVVYGVLDARAAPCVTDNLLRLEIPRTAFEVRVVEPIVDE